MEQLQCNVTHFHVREKKIGSYLVAVNPFAAFVDFSFWTLRFAESLPPIAACVALNVTQERIRLVGVGVKCETRS